jgi:hypothetical protein
LTQPCHNDIIRLVDALSRLPGTGTSKTPVA